MNKRNIFISLALLFSAHNAISQNWIPIEPEASPYTRWWWLGSAVDTANIRYNLSEYAKGGIGGVEITPIYGVKDNDKNNIDYLSPEWMSMLSHVETTGEKLGIETNMSTGTGWPFGGPEVPQSEGAAKAIFNVYDIEGGKGEFIDISVTDEKQKPISSPLSAMAYSTEENSDGTYDYKEIIDITSKVQKAPMPNGKGANYGFDSNLLPEGKWTVVALYCGRTRQQVKRAAPGGEGLVIDHFDKEAVRNYLERFDKAFEENGVKPPHTFFNDSYEVYGADWTPRLLDEFEKRRGYRLQNYFPDFLRAESQKTDRSRRLISDYRQTIGELLLENFTTQWTDWAHMHGSITRNQAHGSPANLIDIYAAVDIPECEGFGLSDFNIKGLRKDPGFTKKNDSDISMLKYASSGAHISGKKFTSSETFTWLTEHFRTSLSQCKPDLDLLFVSGVNHIFFHGSCYSPREDEWPGWRFYASVDMTPNNSIWRDMPAFSEYIKRCQSFLQWGEPDNDLLVYLPYYDMIYEQPDRIALFDIHSMERRAPKFIKAIQSIIKNGYDVDYISDKYLEKTTLQNGHLTTTGRNNYSSIIIPDVRFMPLETLNHIFNLAKQGATVIFINSLPQSVPGFGNSEEQKRFETLIEEFKKDANWDTSLLNENNLYTVAHKYGNGMVIGSDTYEGGIRWCNGRSEQMRNEQGLSCIRRSNPHGFHYFISNLQNADVDAWITLGVKAESAAFYNPMNGKITEAQVRQNGNNTQVRMQLLSGESIILRTFTEGTTDKIMAESGLSGKIQPHKYHDFSYQSAISLNGKWTLKFIESAPQPIKRKFKMEGTPKSWVTFGDELCNTTMATGLYTTNFVMDKSMLSEGKSIILDLGDVRESARVRINGKDAGTLFAVPFRTDITELVKKGKNLLEIEVTNLPANRIAELDRRGVEWRKFNEINVVDLNYKKNTYDKWQPLPSGLNSEVKILLQ